MNVHIYCSHHVHRKSIKLTHLHTYVLIHQIIAHIKHEYDIFILLKQQNIAKFLFFFSFSSMRIFHHIYIYFFFFGISFSFDLLLLHHTYIYDRKPFLPLIHVVPGTVISCSRLSQTSSVKSLNKVIISLFVVW